MSSVTNRTLENYIQTIALEQNFVTNAINRLLDYLPDFKTRLSEAIVDSHDQSKVYAELSKNIKYKEKQVSQVVGVIPFSEVGEMLVPVPENFKGNYIKYLDTLLELSADVYRQDLAVLKQYETMLSVFITNKEARLSTFVKEKAYFKEVSNIRNKTSMTLHTFFPKETGVSIARAKDIVGRMGDFTEISKKAVDLAAIHNTVDVSKINNITQSCTELLGIIIKNIENGECKDASPDAALALSEGAYTVAQYVEMISAFYYSTTVAITVADQILEKVVNPQKK